MGSRGRGGYQAPAAPAAVSGPGALAQRTDGGPGQKITPTPASRPGGQQGDRQASIDQQHMAPLRQGGVAAPVPAGGMVDPGMAEAPPANADQAVWGPTARPWEPVTAGAQLGAGAGAPNPDDSTAALLLALYKQHGNDAIRDVLEELQTGMGR